MVGGEADKRERRITLLLSIALFVAACATPALEMRSEYRYATQLPARLDTHFGIGLLIVGWLVLALGLPILAWLGNLTLLLGWIALASGRWRLALLLAATSPLFAADLLRLIPGGTPPLGPINPQYHFIERPLLGCYLLLARWWFSRRARPSAGGRTGHHARR